MQYNRFANIYDKLMKPDINYEKTADFIENIFVEFDKYPSLVADLACGTGNITIPMARRGYEMIGVDISEDMLSVAREKAAEENTDILFLNQDITKLDLYGTCDAFLCMVDGFNYILQPQKIEYMLKRIKTCFLNPGGILIFDISTRYKLENILGSDTFIYDDGDVFYTWENKYLKKQALVKMYLNFFLKNKNGTYERFFEEHIQRAHTENELKGALRKAGFENVEVFDGHTLKKPNETSERITIAAF